MREDNKKGRLTEHWKLITAMLVIYDIVTVALSYFLALWIRFDFEYTKIDPDAWQNFHLSIPFYIVVCIIVYATLRLYRSIWRFASYRELYYCIIATIITFIINFFGTWIVFGHRLPGSYYIIGIVLQFVFAIGVRFSYRFILMLRSRVKPSAGKGFIPVAIFGAGEAGRSLVRDILVSKGETESVACFFDDNPNKWGRYIDGFKVYGGRNKVNEAVNEYGIKKIYISMPSASPSQKKEIFEVCKNTGCELKNLPGAFQFRKGEITVSNMKDVDVEDLLGRDPIKADVEPVLKQIKGKRILITGGGGSIGSELARQVASHEPELLVIFDIYENNAYSIQLELKKKYPELHLETIIGSVRDSRKLFDVFETYRPDIVYHAAAHKHVPLMEDSPCEAIKNNVIGTYKTAFAAMVYNTKRFVLISTDKAVNPTNVMGASKRMCEMIIQSFDKKVKEEKAYEIPQLFTHLLKNPENLGRANEALKTAKTEFTAVRFGNVLGSNGSVIPLFKKQIAAGGPVTVTHPEIIRYFMTIPEAVSLVLVAGANAQGGEISVLDMGEPVKIDTLARNLILLSGHKPDEDIKIVYTGLRPGEKLYEEKLMAEEGLKKTENDLIHVGLPIPFDEEKFLEQLDWIMKEAYNNRENIREDIKQIVSTYHPSEE